MTRLVAPVLALLLALAGCLRVGPGEDLHLVCEEKTASPRMAYDVGFMIAQTKVEGELEDMDKVALLETARHHVITMGGRPHDGFSAKLAAGNDSTWRFEAVGVRDEGSTDVYEVDLTLAGGSAQALDVVHAPRSIRDIAWRAANASATNASEDAPRATWDPALASCVSLAYADRTLTVNVVQERVVLVEGR